MPIVKTPGGDRKTQAVAEEIANTKGIVLFRQNSLGKARDLLEEALRIRRNAGLDGGIGDDGTLNNIGMIYLKQHRYAQAEVPFLRSIEITRRILGSSHPDLTITVSSLGEVYTGLGRYSEAKEQYQRSLSILWNMSPRLYGRSREHWTLLARCIFNREINPTRRAPLAKPLTSLDASMWPKILEYRTCLIVMQLC